MPNARLPIPHPDLGFEVRTRPGFDGTPLRYWIRRREPRWLVTCTGYGGTFVAWKPLFEALDPAWSVLLWDYRGQFGSEAPPGDIPIQISDHSRDLEVLLAAERVERYAIMGWSVGVQVVLEHYRRRPEGVQAMVLIHGAHERVLHAPLGPGLGARLVRNTTRTLARVAAHVQPLVRPLVRSRSLARLAGKLGVVRGNVEDFAPALAAWEDLDLGRYLKMTLAADDHVTSDMLDRVDVPVLITAGDRDLISPPAQAERLREQLPQAELAILEGTTHYAIIERPELCARTIDHFLARKLRPSM